MAKYIDFALVRDTGKTYVWNVVSTYDGGATRLGEVKWFGRWRTYAFFSANNTVFEPTCLDDVSAFIRKAMDERRQASAS